MKLFLSCFFALAITLSSSAQTTLTGTVKDQSGKGIPNASIKIEGQDVYATLNTAGGFTLKLSDGYETLIVTAKGFKGRTIYLTGASTLDIVLTKEAPKNDVNTGFGSQSKEDMTSSVSSVDASDISGSPLINLEQANQGVTAGLFVQNSSGKLGQGTTVRVRGGSSLSASNQPLYVVDGVPLTSGNQSNINPSNIASIEILKDASATAIYGTRAANGVIIITTKSGASGKMQVNVDYQFGVGQTPQYLDLMTPAEYNQQVIEFSLRAALSSADENKYITKENLVAWEASGNQTLDFGDGSSFTLPAFYLELTNNTDWQKEVFKNAPSHRANIDVQGGTENLGYFASFGYTTQEGILIGNQFDRMNGTVSLNSKITSKLSANLNFNYIRSEDNRLNDDQDLGNPLQAIVLPPSDAYDVNNNYQLLIRSNEYNPLTEINFADNVATNNSIIGSLGLKYKFSELFSIDVNGGVDRSDTRVERRQGPETLEGAPSGRSRLSEQEIRNSIFNGWLTYNPSLSGDNELSIILGGSYQESTGTFDFRLANVNSIATLEALDENDASLQNDPIQGSANVLISSYARVNYSIGNLYDIQVSGRMDGSSKFSENNRFGYFPAISAGWNIQNADFFSSNTFSQLKLKASYGFVGNTPADDFLYRKNYINTRYDDEEAIELSNLGNETLKWETTAQLNVGIDFGMLDDRLSGSVDYYIKTTDDLLFPVPVSQTSGFSTIFDNIGSMENKGFELNVSSENVKKSDFSWTTDFNISFNENTVTDLGGKDLTVGVNTFREGQSAGVFYLRKYMGVDSSTGDALYDDGIGGTTTDWDAAPRQVLGDPNPDFFGGLTNSISFRNWNFSAMFQFVGGADLYFATGEFLSNSGILLLNQHQSQTDRWYAPGDEAAYPALDPFQDNTNSSSRWIQDGSYIRLKNITITYNLPAEKVANMGLRNMSVYVGASNLLTFTKYTGYDPDVSYFDPLDGIIGQNISRGIDNFTTPQARIFMGGIKIGL